MRRHLLTLVVLLLSSMVDAALACSSGPRPSVKELYARAPTVFLARLVRVEEIATGGSNEALLSQPPLEATFEVIEIFKGDPPPSGKIKLPPPDSCDSPMLLVALDHVLFLTDQALMRSRHDAMLLYDPPHDDIAGERKRLLEQLRSLSERQPK